MKKTYFFICLCLTITLAYILMMFPESALAQGITNPLKVNSIQELIAAVLKFVANLLAVAGVIYIMWSGFLLVKAQGDPKALEEAKKSFTNAIIGLAIVLGSWALANMIANTLSKITKTDVSLKKY